MVEREDRWWHKLLRGAVTLAAAPVAALAVFLVLPVMQTIGSPAPNDLMVRNVDIGNLPPPPPPPPQVEPEEEEPPPPPPQLVQEAPPLDLSQLELALNPVAGEALFGDFTVKLVSQLADGEGGEEVDRIFSLAELDKRPNLVYQRMPSYPPQLRREKRQGTVYIIFLVDTLGRVLKPKIQKSTDPAFDRAALDAVKQWRFEPGTRDGQKVQFKMRVPITFNPG
jgi:protein TonB